MISESEALAALLQAIPSGAGTESLALLECLNRRSANRVQATLPLPGFNNSMMDGYAVRAAETATREPLAVLATQPAGVNLGLALEGPRQAIRIYTGAPIPQGADAIIMQEDVTLDGASIICNEPVAVDENVRRQGSDLCPGQVILQPGDLITPGRIGLLASQGITRLQVFRLPRIAVLSTGDELVPPGVAPLLPGQLYNSNAPMLVAMLNDMGLAVSQVSHCPDSLPATIRILDDLAGRHDILLLSGGVSVGDKDHVKPALAALGMPPQLWRIRVKPGKPFLFTHRTEPQPLFVFGLPGNPVSTFVTFHLFVRPALLKWIGTPEDSLYPPAIQATLAQDLANATDRPHYMRGLVKNGIFQTSGLQRSDALFALAQANSLLRLAPGEQLEAGTAVQVLCL